jgi:hypothetical protein
MRGDQFCTLLHSPTAHNCCFTGKAFARSLEQGAGERDAGCKEISSRFTAAQSFRPRNWPFKVAENWALM